MARAKKTKKTQLNVELTGLEAAVRTVAWEAGATHEPGRPNDLDEILGECGSITLDKSHLSGDVWLDMTDGDRRVCGTFLLRDIDELIVTVPVKAVAASHRLTYAKHQATAVGYAAEAALNVISELMVEVMRSDRYTDDAEAKLEYLHGMVELLKDAFSNTPVMTKAMRDETPQYALTTMLLRDNPPPEKEEEN